MKCGIALAACLLFVVIASERSFVDTAPTSGVSAAAGAEAAQLTGADGTSTASSTQQGSPEIVPETLDANVRELESLKQSIGKTLEMMKTHSAVYSNINGHKETHSDTRAEVKENGQLVAGLGQRINANAENGEQLRGNIRTEIDIPERNIHQSSVQRLVPGLDENQQQQYNEKRTFGSAGENVENGANNLAEKFAGTQYSAMDMADYVFWTGDEKGVTLAIEEFLQAGLMSREEAIAFLQEIKYNLDYLQSHYAAQLGLNARDRSKQNSEDIAKQLMKSKQAMEQLQQQQLQMQQQQQMMRPELKNNFDITKLRYQPNKKSSQFDIQSKESDLSKLMDQASQQQQLDEEYDELLERLRVADFLYTEYSLEEVIYQLAKVMFTQSLTRGSSEAQQALQKFTTFLETEANQGHISRALEKKVLDVLIASLSDTLGEHPELQAIDPYARNSDRQNVLRQIVQMIPKDKEMQDQLVDIQLKDERRIPLATLAKYKTMQTNRNDPPRK